MHLRNDMRQKNTQKHLDFNSTPTSEARAAGGEATESFSARHAPENPASTNQLMEEVCERENLKRELHKVKGQQR
jgi:RNA-directed DNA polymerase